METPRTTVLILTPVKTASRYLAGYFSALESLTYPHELLSLGILEGDSEDNTFSELERLLATSCRRFASKILLKKDFGSGDPEGHASP